MVPIPAGNSAVVMMRQLDSRGGQQARLDLRIADVNPRLGFFDQISHDADWDPSLTQPALTLLKKNGHSGVVFGAGDAFGIGRPSQNGGDGPMLIHDLACAIDGGRRVLSAAVVWEERDFPTQRLTFDIGDPQSGGEWIEFGADPLLSEDPVPDAFLAACFPLAAVHGEARIRVEGRACPMLVEGLRTAYAWWSSWGGMPSPAPRIETAARGRFTRHRCAAPSRRLAFRRRRQPAHADAKPPAL